MRKFMIHFTPEDWGFPLFAQMIWAMDESDADKVAKMLSKDMEGMEVNITAWTSEYN